MESMKKVYRVSREKMYMGEFESSSYQNYDKFA